jgi:anhydro-N-acetylmuramic acid kinase
MTHPLHTLLRPGARTVLGLMSGTSLDGVDAVVARLDGSGRDLRVETLGFVSRAYDAPLRAALRACVEAASSDVRMVSQLHVRLAHHLADVAEEALAAAGLGAADLDLVGSHGQTVQHVPVAEACAGEPTRSTLQIGCPATLAARLGAPVLSDFRAADMALGGQGAPLAPYLDAALFRSDNEPRVLLNLGGIANVTFLPAGGPPGMAFDTGPANMVMDALAHRLTGRAYDADGAIAARGTPDEALLADPYYDAPPPKSTGREDYGTAFLDRFVAEGPPETADLLATAAALTARSVAHAVQRQMPARPARVIASGGGVRNPTLLRHLADALGPDIALETTAAYGLDPDAKEAVLFAVLAHEWANGVRTGLPAVTGAARPAFQGSLTLP